MSEKKDGGAAFPRPTGGSNAFENKAQKGMSLRDWFAGQATDEDIKYYQTYDSAGKPHLLALFRHEARWCFADAMLAEREKE